MGRGEEVPMDSIDRWVESNLAGNSVDVLKIDAEGFDPLVLDGAHSTIRMAWALVFELNSVGMWKTTDLGPIVHWIDEAGMDCYFVASGRMLKLECGTNGAGPMCIVCTEPRPASRTRLLSYWHPMNELQRA